MKCFNKVIFSKLIFSVKVLMKCSREYVACFLRLLIILKCTLEYFYDGSKQYESISDCNSCHILNFLFRVVYYFIRGILWLYSAHCLLIRKRKVDASLSILLRRVDSVRENDFNLHFPSRNRNLYSPKRRYMSVFTAFSLGGI